MAAAREYDIVVFGATGFTGRRVAQNLATSSGFKGCAGAAGVRRCRLPSLVPACLSSQTSLDLHHSRSKWAIAGRDRARLDALAASLSASSPGVLVADATDAASLAAMAAAAAVVINTVGPFRLYSQPVVAACVASGTDYLDVCGEPDFIERVELEFDEAARDKGVYVASACGFDSVPGEFAVQVRGGGGGGGRRVEMAGRRARACVRARPLATRNTHIHTPSLRSPQYTMSLFRPPARCTSVETALTIHAGPAGFRGHYATFQSAVLGFAGAGELRRLRKEAEQARLQGRGRWHCRGWWMAERGSRPAGPSACSPPLPRLPCRAMPSLPLAPWRRSAARPCSLWCLAPSRRARRVLHGTHASEPTPILSWCGGRVHGCMGAWVPDGRRHAAIQALWHTHLPTCTSSRPAPAHTMQGADASVVRRTMRSQDRPAHVSVVFTLPSRTSLALWQGFGAAFAWLAQRDWGRDLLLRYPRLFSYGLFTHEGPSEEQMAGTSFSFTSVGKGYSQGEGTAAGSRHASCAPAERRAAMPVRLHHPPTHASPAGSTHPPSVQAPLRRPARRQTWSCTRA